MHPLLLQRRFRGSEGMHFPQAAHEPVPAPFDDESERLRACAVDIREAAGSTSPLPQVIARPDPSPYLKDATAVVEWHFIVDGPRPDEPTGAGFPLNRWFHVQRVRHDDDPELAIRCSVFHVEHTPAACPARCVGRHAGRERYSEAVVGRNPGETLHVSRGTGQIQQHPGCIAVHPSAQRSADAWCRRRGFHVQHRGLTERSSDAPRECIALPADA